MSLYDDVECGVTRIVLTDEVKSDRTAIEEEKGKSAYVATVDKHN
jgi:hypothetical protein